LFDFIALRSDFLSWQFVTMILIINFVLYGIYLIQGLLDDIINYLLLRSSTKPLLFPIYKQGGGALPILLPVSLTGRGSIHAELVYDS